MANMSTDQYVRPGFTGRPLRYSDGKLDYGFSQCPSCLGFHADSNLDCNGKREPSTRQCEAVLGEIRCQRPDNHTRQHEAESSALRVEWEVK